MTQLLRKQTSFVLFLLLLASLLLSLHTTAAAADKVVVVPLINTVKGVPKTGQTLCYSADWPNTQIPCAGTGQDGELQKGITWPVPRFKDNLNGTVVDNLIWLSKSIREKSPLP